MSHSLQQANWRLADWLVYLEQQHHKEIDMSLERINLVVNALCADKPAKTVITVAGTNGKGSTVRYMEQILLACGHRVASYSSPHFIDYKERVRINGQELTDAEHCLAFQAVEQARGDTSLTYFEFGTLAAFWLMAQHQLDYAVLEIGLGGRLDAVNIIEPDVSIVTSVGIDHVEFLGNDREQIGFEKAGVYRAGKVAICGDPEPPQRLLAHAHSLQADLRCVNRDYTFKINAGDWQFESRDWQLSNLPFPHLPLVNAATALAALGALPQQPDLASVRSGLLTASLPGRMQVLSQQPLVLLDVAHNPHAAQYLAAQLQQRWPQRRVRAVVGMLKDKDISATLKCLHGQVNAWYCATTPGPRGSAGTQLAQHLHSAQQADDCPASLAQASVYAYPDIAQAFKTARMDAEAGDIVLCFGSFLTIQAILQLEG